MRVSLHQPQEKSIHKEKMMPAIRRQDDVETIQFPAPKRRRRRHYAPAKSLHGHWAWIGVVFGASVLLGVLVLLRAPAFFWPFMGISNGVAFFAILYGVIRSATR